MEIKTDLHLHTTACNHAYSTYFEYIELANRRGIELIAFTDHSHMLGLENEWTFQNLPTVPKQVDNVSILYGAEANIINVHGSIDLYPKEIHIMDIVIASAHWHYSPRDAEEHAECCINTLANNDVDILGHADRFDFAIDAESIVKAAIQHNKLIEINNHTFDMRQQAKDNCLALATACKKLGAQVVVNSDSHICYTLGQFDAAVAMLASINFPYELIANKDKETFMKYLSSRGKKCR